MTSKGILYLCILFTLVSCASKPTPYKKEKNNEGYSNERIADIRVASFRGSQNTKISEARLFAEFRAVELCLRENYKFANILDIFDKTKSKEVIKTDSNMHGPAYYGGMYPFYSRHSSFGMGVHFSQISSRTWSETYVFPHIQVPFTCSHSVFRPRIMLKEIPAGEMNHLVKDVKGGVQIEKIMDDSPNKNILRNDDIILRAEDIRVERVYQLIQLFSEKKQSLKVTLLREGKTIGVTMKSEDVSDDAAKAEETIIKDACKYKSVKKKHKNDLCSSKL